VEGGEAGQKGEIEAWEITSILWDLKDLEWKSVVPANPENLKAFHLEKPRLVLSLFKKGSDEPITLSAGWKDPEQPQAEEKSDKGEKALEPEDKSEAPKKPDPDSASKVAVDAAALPETIHVTVKPHEEKDVIFSVEGKLMERLLRDLNRLSAPSATDED
jgi:hypothetical protein